MQLAGRKCNLCGEKIVFADEARFCSRCDTVVHLGCDEGVCSVCGTTLTGYVPPKADALNDAIVPRALRPGKTGAAAFAILILFLVVLFVLYLSLLA